MILNPVRIDKAFSAIFEQGDFHETKNLARGNSMKLFCYRKTCLSLNLVAMLTACGGGSSGSSTPATPAAIQGTVASGNPIAQAVVVATDINGKTATATADSNGNYTLTTASLSAPLVLVATDPSGQVSPVVSVLASLPVAGKTSVANVTTLTSAVSSLLTTDGNALDFVTPGAATTLSAVSTASVQKASATLNTYLANVLAAYGLNTTFDAVATPFVANHTGADAVIDLVEVVNEGKVTELVSRSAQNVAYLNLSTTGVANPAAPLPPPSAALVANQATLSAYLSALPASLTSCLSGANSAACSAVFDAGYKDNGYTSIQKYDTDLSNASLALGTPQIVQLATDGSSALISVPYSIGSGTNLAQYSFVTTVHPVATPITLPGGTQVSWNVIGNQLKYDATVATRVTRRYFYDTFANSNGNPDVSFYDAGILLNFNLNGPNASNVNSILVTGPGLPAGGLYLVNSSVTGAGLSIAATQPTSPPSASYRTGSDTNEYRWSWQAIKSTDTFTPPTKGFWATTPVDVTTIPVNATYVYTLYDASGTQLDQMSVVNSTPPTDASLGTKVPWAILGTDVVTNVLSPGGSLAGAVTSVPVDFTTAPFQPSLYQASVQSETASSAGVIATAQLPAGASSVTVSTPACTPACPFDAINTSTGTYRIVQLRGKNQQGIRFFDNQTYRNGTAAPNAS